MLTHDTEYLHMRRPLGEGLPGACKGPHQRWAYPLHGVTCTHPQTAHLDCLSTTNKQPTMCKDGKTNNKPLFIYFQVWKSQLLYGFALERR